MIKLKTSRLGVPFLSAEALQLVKHRQLKSRSVEELVRFAKILKLRSKRFSHRRWQLVCNSH